MNFIEIEVRKCVNDIITTLENGKKRKYMDCESDSDSSASEPDNVWDTKDPTEFGYDKKGRYVKFGDSSDFEEDEYGNWCLKS